ncbi:MAG TPA: flagellar hook-length control protein FliK, partial [Bryobacteraceae bacterium]|nr:flagellar hook-length control protein FliK [Bryobacteraceae bacterium]
MIPADVAGRLQVSADAALRPVAQTQEIADKLSGLVAGQKVMAEIQAMLPNGTYRAMINQRSITLALPFSAKSGDSLELQVTENDGKLALAVLSRQDGSAGKAGAESVSATLSRTGQLISSLFAGTNRAQGRDAHAVPLNGNQPIATAPPNTAQDLLPLLKQAITQSGMFYESHQAEWVEGRLPKAALLQEPQGKLSSPAAFASALAEEQGVSQNQPRASTGEPAVAARITADLAQSSNTSVEGSKAAIAQSQTSGQVVAPQTQPLVQQQLEALATQNFSWQGQVWPGQEMRWEIDEDATRSEQDGEDSAPRWSTRLHLTLPNLGEVDARIRLEGNSIAISMTADSAGTRTLMRVSSSALRSQLD